MTLVEHLQELRARILVCAGALGAASVAGYLLAAPLLAFIRRPLGDRAPLVFTSLGDAFFSVLRVAFMFGVLTSAPVVLWQAWCFVAPGLEEKERRVVRRMLPVAYLLFVSGMAFAYYFVVPFAVRFFLSYAGQSLTPLLSLEDYLSFVTGTALMFGLIFELPIALFALMKLGLVRPEALRRNRKVALFVVFVLAAVITPTGDAINMILAALPLWGLFELSMVLAAAVE